MLSLSRLTDSTMSLNAGETGNDVTECGSYTLSSQEDTPHFISLLHISVLIDLRAKYLLASVKIVLVKLYFINDIYIFVLFFMLDSSNKM